MTDREIQEAFDTAYGAVKERLSEVAESVKGSEDRLAAVLGETRFGNGPRKGVEAARKHLSEARRALTNTVKEHLSREKDGRIQEESNEDHAETVVEALEES